MPHRFSHQTALTLLIPAFFAWTSCSTPSEDVDALADAGVSDVGHRTDSATDDLAVCAEGPGQVFEERIRPLIENDQPSSCAKCHANEVNLAAFVTGDACSSMACLVSQDLVDLSEPRESALLGLIERGFDQGAETTPNGELAAAEYEGFLRWIEWSAKCMSTECADTTACGGIPATPLVDMGTDDSGADMYEPPPPALTRTNYPCDDAAQTQAFLEHAFPGESRCGHCHAPDGAIAGIGGAPTWVGRDVDLNGARRTIENLYQLGAINLDNPRKSRVLLKPLLPELGGIEHGGGSKFLSFDDPLYQSLLGWIRLQRDCRRTLEYPPRRELSNGKSRIH